MVLVGDELAAIYDPVDHCRNADCVHAKAFYDEMHSLRESDTLQCSIWSLIYFFYFSFLRKHVAKKLKLDETATKHRWPCDCAVVPYLPGFQKGATWPKRFIVKQVAIRRALFMPGSASSIVDCE